MAFMRCQKTNRRIAKCAFAFLFGLLSLGLCPAEEAEALFVNGAIWTANSKQPRVEATLVRGERIHFAGSRAESACVGRR